MAKPSIPDQQNRPNQDGRDRDLRKDRSPVPGAGGEPREILPDIADADTKARTGKKDEQLRNTPPFGDFDDLRDDLRK
jgi:hypothetical protein